MTTINEIEFNGEEKIGIRQFIISILKARKVKSFVDFWGNGEMYHACKKALINVFSIDNGSDFRKLPKDRKALKKKLSNQPDKAYISLKKLSKTQRQDDAFWLDYCGSLGSSVWSDLEQLPPIMTEKGTLFITYQEGHETTFPRGTDRRLINRYYSDTTIEIMNHVGINLKEFLKFRYISKPNYGSRKKLNGTPMITIGYNWTKI